MNKYPSERLFCLNIVLTVDEKWFTARIKPPQVRLIPVADDMSEETGRFRLESLGSAEVLPVPKSMLFGALRRTRAARKTNQLDWYSEWAA